MHLSVRKFSDVCTLFTLHGFKTIPSLVSSCLTNPSHAENPVQSLINYQCASEFRHHKAMSRLLLYYNFQLLFAYPKLLHSSGPAHTHSAQTCFSISLHNLYLWFTENLLFVLCTRPKIFLFPNRLSMTCDCALLSFVFFFQSPTQNKQFQMFLDHS